MESKVISDSHIDRDITVLREKVQSARLKKSILSAILASSPQSKARLLHAKAQQSSNASASASTDAALDLVTKFQKRSVENVYRTCVGVTSFRVKDPDPHAVDDGNVLGVRLDVFERGSSIPPYYLFLHKPTPGRQDLKFYKHTIPPVIPLQKLVAKYLAPPTTRLGEQCPAQNLHRLIRELRRHLTAYHLRKSTVERIESGALHPAGSKPRCENLGCQLKRVAWTDLTMNDLRIEWKDGSVGRTKVTSDGRLESCVVVDPNSSSRNKERKIMGDDRRLETLGDRLGKCTCQKS